MVKSVVRPVTGNVGRSIEGFSGGWLPYWKSQSECYEIWKITSEGSLIGLKRGDILTVGGTVGSYTFQVPNTSPYQGYDIDYLLFTSAVAQRTVTEAEMVGYDFSRTIVRYGNASPYSIEYIMILSSVFSTAKENRMRDDFNLSVWWNNTLSFHGSEKGNRGTVQSFWYTVPAIRAMIGHQTATKVDIIFPFDLDPTSVPDITTGTLAGKTITAVAIVGKVLTYTASVTYAWGDTPTVGYTVPATNPLKTLQGTRIATFAAQAVENYINFIGHWKLNEGSGLVAIDSGDYKYDGAIVGALWVAGKLSFDGNDYVNCDAHVVLNPPISSWGMFVTPTDATPVGTGIFFAIGDTDANNYLALYYLSTGVLVGRAVTTAGVRWDLRTNANPFTDGVRCHIGITHNGTAPILYVNGVAVAQTFITSTDKTIWKHDYATLDNVRIGCWNINNAGNAGYFIGTIDDVRDYNRVLTPAEMVALAAM